MAHGDITVIGGGWSVGNLDLTRLAGLVIAVNDSAIYAPRWDYAVSMDRLWTENRIDQLERIAWKVARRQVWIRTSALQNLPSTKGMPWLYPFTCDHLTNYFTAAADSLNGTNSGACALNLAWQLQPKRVFLLGFDMNRNGHGAAYWYPNYTWPGGTSDSKYRTWAAQFSIVAKLFTRTGCEVFNVSPSSSIAAFPKMTPAQYRKEAS